MYLAVASTRVRANSCVGMTSPRPRPSSRETAWVRDGLLSLVSQTPSPLTASPRLLGLGFNVQFARSVIGPPCHPHTTMFPLHP